MDARFFIHYGLHFGLPVLVALLINKKQWFKIWLILISTMLIDLDHLFANPIFDINRCSINFHFLHSYYAIGIYVIGLFFKKTKILAIGLLLHIFADFIDCLLIIN